HGPGRHLAQPAGSAGGGHAASGWNADRRRAVADLLRENGIRDGVFHVAREAPGLPRGMNLPGETDHARLERCSILSLHALDHDVHPITRLKLGGAGARGKCQMDPNIDPIIVLYRTDGRYAAYLVKRPRLVEVR